MNKVIGFILLISAICAHAGEACHLTLDSQVSISKSAIIMENEQARYEIQQDRNLLVDGKPVTLTAQQQQLVSEYAQQVRALIPVTQNLALDAIDLAIGGVKLAFDELLGENNSATEQLLLTLNDTKLEVNRYFSLEHKPLVINSMNDSADDFFDKAFEQRFEAAVESSMEQVAGSVLMALGKEILTGGGIGSLEQRMNAFGQRVENEMNLHSAQLEARGAELCQSVVMLNGVEQKMQNTILALADFDVIKTSE